MKTYSVTITIGAEITAPALLEASKLATEVLEYVVSHSLATLDRGWLREVYPPSSSVKEMSHEPKAL